MAEERFGPYLLCGLLGQGGMGEVHRAVDLVKQRQVAVKRLPASLAADREFQRRFRRESDLAARLQDPHVVPIHHYGEIDGALFIEMPLVEGGDLGSRLRAGPLPPAEAIAIVTQVASALDAAHAAGLVHRDVKPSNVLLTGEHAYLGDFGVARAVTGATTLTGTGAIVGTLAYLAPERFSGGGDARADVYSLACVLYEALTGQAPFGREGLPTLMYAHLRMPPPRPSQHADVPSTLDGVVARGMAKDPARRYSSAGQFAAAARVALSAATDPRLRPALVADAPADRTWDDAPVLRPRAATLLRQALVGGAIWGAVVVGFLGVAMFVAGEPSGDPAELAGLCAVGALIWGLVTVGLVVIAQRAAALRLRPPRLLPGECAIVRGWAATRRRPCRRGCLYLTDQRLIFRDTRPGTPRSLAVEWRHDEFEPNAPARQPTLLDIDARDSRKEWFPFRVDERAAWLAAIERARGGGVGP